MMHRLLNDPGITGYVFNKVIVFNILSIKVKILTKQFQLYKII